MPEHGVVLPTRGAVMTSETPTELTAKTAAEVVGLAERAEHAGFDSVWVGDSVLAKPRHEPLTTLAALATATESVRLGTSVYLPALRDPVHVAHQTATVDQLSGGRLCLGVGVGSGGEARDDRVSVAGEARALDVPWGRRGSLVNEHLDVLDALWAGERVDYDGEFLSYDGASIGFEPCRRPPLYVGGHAHPGKGVSKPVRRRVAAHGDGWFPTFADRASLATGREQVADALAAVDRSLDDLSLLMYHDVVVADTEREALDAAREFTARYYPGATPTDEELRTRGIFGPPEHVAAELAAYADAGVDHFVTRFAAENQYDQLQRFAAVLD